MKIDKSNFSLLLMVEDEKQYDGSFNIRYNDKIFGKDMIIEDSVIIDETDYGLSPREKTLITQINKLIEKNLGKKGFEFEKWILTYSYNSMSTLSIEYKLDETINYFNFNLIEDQMICKKALTLSRFISKRLLKEFR